MALEPLPLSVAIICKNSAGTIGRTLGSVAGLAEEVVAVDSGSTDGTIEMLERCDPPARVIRTEWKGYIATKQMALEACTRPWILCLDSDESVLPELAEAIRGAIGGKGGSLAGSGATRHSQSVVTPPPRGAGGEGGGVAGYEVNRKVFYRDRPLDFAWQPEWRLRLVRRGRARWAGLDPHDRLELLPGGEDGVGRLRGDLRHDSIGTFSAFMAKQALHARTMAWSMWQEGQRGSLWRMTTSPVGAFLKQLVLKQAWRDGYRGWLAAASTAAGALMKHAILVEISRAERGAEGGGGGGPGESGAGEA